jgi:hypothetical protein
MSDERDRGRKNRTRAIGIVVGAAVATVFPVAGAVIGLASFFGGARRYARSGEIDDATDMVLGFTDASGGAKND